MNIILINALCCACLACQIWAVSVKPLKDLPGYLAFGSIIGATLTFIH